MVGIGKLVEHRRRGDTVRFLPFADLMHRAQTLHRAHFDPNAIETASLLSIKTGGCPEDCGYCPQSVHHDTGVDATKLMEADKVREAAELAKAAGATRFCMGAAWRAPRTATSRTWSR